MMTRVADSRAALVVSLDSIPDSGVGRFGAKAANLARLLRLGLPVPPGFCVSAEAYRAHISTGDLRQRLKTAVQEVRESAAERELNRQERQGRQLGGLIGLQKLAEARKLITDVPLAIELRSEIERAYQALDSAYLAVRSSGTAEDLPGHSFAGLYSTFLGKADLWTCFGQIKDCWASLWTERAFDYREKNRFDHLNASMSVLVQKLIPAEAAGVAFTADPVSGARDRVTVESCFGLGEALVSGKVSPDRFVLTKPDLRLEERSIANKTVQTVFAQEWGVREWPVEAERREQPSIDDATARRVGELALKVEQAFGKPQDIEWAVLPPHLFLLQSRPITTLADRAAEDRIVWSNVNVGEAMPEPAPPLAHSGFRIFARNLLGYIARMAGVDMGSGDLPLFNEIAGREYFNLNLIWAWCGEFRSWGGWT